MAKHSHQDAIPQTDLLAFIEQQEGAVDKREIAKAFHLTGHDKILLKQQLRRLADQGLIPSAKRPKQTAFKERVFIATVSHISEDGVVFAAPENADNIEQHVEVTGQRAAQLSVGQRIRVRRLARKNVDTERHDQVALIHRISEEQETQIAVVIKENGRVWAEPVSRRGRGLRITLVAHEQWELRHGALVLVQIISKHRGAIAGKILELLGTRLDSPQAVSMVAIHEHDIPHQFSEAVFHEAEAAEPLDCIREDLSHLPFVTIDPKDARDHDDALYACPTPDNPAIIHLYVAIADVSAYVRGGGLLDQEACKRGNSVYFPDRVVPMLPEQLSNGLCSLKMGQERLAFVCRLRVGEDGQCTDPKFFRARIKVQYNFAYEEAQTYIDKPDATSPISLLLKAYNRMAQARDLREPLDLDVPEHQIHLDTEGRVHKITLRDRFDAHRLVEECMIQANVAAGTVLAKHGSPALYRNHEEPPRDRLITLKTSFDAMGLNLALGNRLTPALFNHVIKRLTDSPMARTVSEMILRCQTQAFYGVDNLGHFGLALPCYAHFTSPIRRYADLIVHRSLITCLKLGQDGLTHDTSERLEAIAEHISKTERTAMAAERDSIARYVAAHMSDHIGRQFEATISGLARMGLFVQLVDNGAEGFIPAAKIGRDYYHYDEQTMTIRGERAGLTFRLGEPVTVRLEEAAPVSGGLRFSLVAPQEPPLRKRALKGHGSRASSTMDRKKSKKTMSRKKHER